MAKTKSKNTTDATSSTMASTSAELLDVPR